MYKQIESDPSLEREFNPLNALDHCQKCTLDKTEAGTAIIDGERYAGECIYEKYQDEIDSIVLEECSVMDLDESAFLENCYIGQVVVEDDDTEEFEGVIVNTPSNFAPRVVITREMIEGEVK